MPTTQPGDGDVIAALREQTPPMLEPQIVCPAITSAKVVQSATEVGAA